MPVAVIIAAHNAEQTLTECLESIKSQKHNNLRCIIVDDGSKDNTEQVARAFATENTNFEYVLKENGGPAAARNYGLDLVRDDCDFVWFLDSDDMLEQNAIATCLSFIAANNAVVTVGCGTKTIHPHGSIQSSGIQSRWVPGVFGPRKLRPKESLTPFVSFFCVTGAGPFALHRTSALVTVGGYDETLWSHEDADLFARMALVGEVHFLKDELYIKRQSGREGLTFVGQAKGGGDIFAAKWYQDSIDTKELDPRITKARAYYYRVHSPLRSLKVAAKTIMNYKRADDKAQSRWWISHLLKNAASDVFKGYKLTLNLLLPVRRKSTQ